jgi:hypothetical protein
MCWPLGLSGLGWEDQHFLTPTKIITVCIKTVTYFTTTTVAADVAFPFCQEVAPWFAT